MNSKQFRYNVCLSAYFTRRQKRWSSYTIIVMCTCSAFKASRWICKLVHLITKSKKFIYIVQTINIHIIYTLRNDLKPIYTTYVTRGASLNSRDTRATGWTILIWRTVKHFILTVKYQLFLIISINVMRMTIK